MRWLVKEEPTNYNYDQFTADGSTIWSGVKNPVAQRNLRSMKKGQSFALKNFYGKQTHDLRIKILGRERVEVPAGTFDCVVVEPMVSEGGLFKSEGRIVVYLTDDDRKIPVKVSTKVAIGSIDGKLTAYSGTRGPLASKRQ